MTAVDIQECKLPEPKETTMTIRHTALAAALALASIGPAHSEELKPLQGQVIDLGDVSGVTYYSAERGSGHAAVGFASRPWLCENLTRPRPTESAAKKVAMGIALGVGY